MAVAVALLGACGAPEVSVRVGPNAVAAAVLSFDEKGQLISGLLSTSLPDRLLLEPGVAIAVLEYELASLEDYGVAVSGPISVIAASGCDARLPEPSGVQWIDSTPVPVPRLSSAELESSCPDRPPAAISIQGCPDCHPRFQWLGPCHASISRGDECELSPLLASLLPNGRWCLQADESVCSLIEGTGAFQTATCGQCGIGVASEPDLEVSYLSLGEPVQLIGEPLFDPHDAIKVTLRVPAFVDAALVGDELVLVGSAQDGLGRIARVDAASGELIATATTAFPLRRIFVREGEVIALELSAKGTAVAVLDANDWTLARSAPIGPLDPETYGVTEPRGGFVDGDQLVVAVADMRADAAPTRLQPEVSHFVAVDLARLSLEPLELGLIEGLPEDGRPAVQSIFSEQVPPRAYVLDAFRSLVYLARRRDSVIDLVLELNDSVDGSEPMVMTRSFGGLWLARFGHAYSSILDMDGGDAVYFQSGLHPSALSSRLVAVFELGTLTARIARTHPGPYFGQLQPLAPAGPAGPVVRIIEAGDYGYALLPYANTLARIRIGGARED